MTLPQFILLYLIIGSGFGTYTAYVYWHTAHLAKKGRVEDQEVIDDLEGQGFGQSFMCIVVALTWPAMVAFWLRETLGADRD